MCHISFKQIFVVLISGHLLIASAYPYQYADTPIQKISIRPATDARPIPLDRSAKTAKVNAVNDSKELNIVVIEKKPKLMTKIPRRVVMMMTDMGKRRAKFNPADGAYPVYYAIARANGSFRNHPIRTITSE